MSHTREEVLELLAQKRISTDEADRLLTAMDRKPGLWAWIVNPLGQIPSGVALALTAVPVAGQMVLERFGVHFDGAIDIHTNGASASWASAAVYAAVGFPLLALVLWATTLLGKRAARLVDVAAAVGLSRWPLTLASLFVLPLARTVGERASMRVEITGPGFGAGAHPDPAAILHQLTAGDYALILASVPLVIWSIVWIVTGFRTATGERGARLGWSVAGGIVVAEVLSKLLLRAAG